jgi:hypothetical protein
MKSIGIPTWYIIKRDAVTSGWSKTAAAAAADAANKMGNIRRRHLDE